MSKAMRIVDREIIERQVVNAWKEKSEANFIREVESEGFDVMLNDLMHQHSGLCDEIDALEKKLKELRQEIDDNVKGFNLRYSEKDNSSYTHDYHGTYIKTSLGHYGHSKGDWEYDTNVPNRIRHGVADELGMQTMGGDFNAKDLVARLIEMFVD